MNKFWKFHRMESICNRIASPTFPMCGIFLLPSSPFSCTTAWTEALWAALRLVTWNITLTLMSSWWQRDCSESGELKEFVTLNLTSLKASSPPRLPTYQKASRNEYLYQWPQSLRWRRLEREFKVMVCFFCLNRSTIVKIKKVIQKNIFTYICSSECF